jgi:acyl-coenzyme A synthetase/AMP-(fatty) acid ligase
VDLARNLIGPINVGDSFKVPKSVIFADQLPKTSTGKVQKNVVRSEHAQHHEAG